ncbi:hypothetical protein WN55_07646 [Dufourea novaeangliae]|uniref:Uncharacterized protein n=1 Tax=Dufourea novaeangliae TaxID=178035 RepID=A0A154P5L6_DUFNO|nr:hypothetical protein WN55_07646 [Dufourea novaeangliae]
MYATGAPIITYAVHTSIPEREIPAPLYTDGNRFFFRSGNKEDNLAAPTRTVSLCVLREHLEIGSPVDRVRHAEFRSDRKQ